MASVSCAKSRTAYCRVPVALEVLERGVHPLRGLSAARHGLAMKNAEPGDGSLSPRRIPSRPGTGPQRRQGDHSGPQALRTGAGAGASGPLRVEDRSQ